MTICTGDKIPAVDLMIMTGEGPRAFSLATACEGKRVVLFAVPGAFTPTCSARHLPGFVESVDAFAAKGIDDIYCLSVNDAFVMGAWGESQQADRISMLADSAAAFTQAVGLDVDLSDFGLGIRSQRYAMLIDDGVVTHLNIEPGPGLEVSSATAMLALV